MKRFFPWKRLVRGILCALSLLTLVVSVRGQFTLEIVPVSPGTGQLGFTLFPGYYYCLEKSGDLAVGFHPASGWMLGDGNPVTWPVHYPASPASSGGGTAVPAGDTFSLYPFANGKTLVTWTGPADARYSTLVVQDYSALPPTVVVPENGTVPSALLLVGRIAWDPAFETLDPALLPPEQQPVLARLPTSAAAMLAATSGGASGSAVVIDSPKHFFRLRRVEADGDNDGLSFAQEVFVYGSDPNNADTDGDGLTDGWEVAWGLNPNHFDSPYTWLVGSGLAAKQLFERHAQRSEYGSLAWQAKKRLHAYRSDGAGGANVISWQDWEGDADSSAAVHVMHEVSEGVWQQVGSTTVAAGSFEVPPSAGASADTGANFKLEGGVSSSETARKARLMMKTSDIQSVQPGMQSGSHWFRKATWTISSQNRTLTGIKEINVAARTVSAKTIDVIHGGETIEIEGSANYPAFYDPLAASGVPGTSGTELGTATSTITRISTPSNEAEDRTFSTTGTLRLVVQYRPLWKDYYTASEMISSSVSDPVGSLALAMPSPPEHSTAEEDVTYTQEYSAGAFYSDTVAKMLPMLGSKGFSYLYGSFFDVSVVTRYYDEFPLHHDNFQPHFFDGPLEVQTSVRSLTVFDTQRFELMKSEYWIECNDCEAGPPVWAVETETVDASGPGESTVSYVTRIVTHPVGSRPGMTTRSATYTADLTGWSVNGNVRLTPVLLPVDIKFMKPDVTTWNDADELKEPQVILFTETTRLRIKVEMKLDTLAQVLAIPEFQKLKFKTHGTKPDGADLALTAANCTFVGNATGFELHVEQTRDQLKTLGVLPQAEQDGVKEIAWFDLVKDPTQSNLSDSQALEAGNSNVPEKDKRGRSYKEAKIKTNGDRPIDKTFVMAGGAQLITAEFAGAPSEKRQLADQADVFYISGHGHYGNGKLEVGHYDNQGNFVVPSDPVPAEDLLGAADMKWDKDAEVVIVGGCSVFGIQTRKFRFPSMNRKDRALFDDNYPGNDPSPGEVWEFVQPKVKLGYCFTAPTDVQGSAAIASTFQALVTAGQDPVAAWGAANNGTVGVNACAIDTRTSPHQYWYLHRVGLKTFQWSQVVKNQGSW